MNNSAKIQPLPTSNRPLIAAVVSALVIYVIAVTLLLAILHWIFGSLSRQSFGGAALLWATYLLPALIAPAAGAFVTGILYGEGGRRAAWWPNLAMIALFTVVAVAWLLIAGGFWNAMLALVQFAGGVLAGLLLHRVARGRNRAA